jgi:hypothetical protein
MRLEHTDCALFRTSDVEGAPARVGSWVRVAAPGEDESRDPRFVGRTGLVTGLLYDDPARQYPFDPLVAVFVEGLGEELFFSHELSGLDREQALVL